MTLFRISLMVLSVLNFLLTVFTAAVGLFADGGDVYSVLLLSVLHPITALAIIALAFFPRLRWQAIVVITAVLIVNILADATLSVLIATGNIKGDWELPIIFTVVPTIGLVYAVIVLWALIAEAQESVSAPDG